MPYLLLPWILEWLELQQTQHLSINYVRLRQIFNNQNILNTVHKRLMKADATSICRIVVLSCTWVRSCCRIWPDTFSPALFGHFELCYLDKKCKSRIKESSNKCRLTSERTLFTDGLAKLSAKNFVLTEIIRHVCSHKCTTHAGRVTSCTAYSRECCSKDI